MHIAPCDPKCLGETPRATRPTPGLGHDTDGDEEEFLPSSSFFLSFHLFNFAGRLADKGKRTLLYGLRDSIGAEVDVARARDATLPTPIQPSYTRFRGVSRIFITGVLAASTSDGYFLPPLLMSSRRARGTYFQRLDQPSLQWSRGVYFTPQALHLSSSFLDCT